MSREFPGQDPYLPPGVSPNHPNFTGPEYESEVDMDYAYQVLGWMEEAVASIEEAIKQLVILGEYTPEIASKDMKLVKEVDDIRDSLEYALKTEERKINGEYDDDDADFAYECWRDDNL